MRKLLTALAILLAASPAWAQDYAEQTYVAPQMASIPPQQISGQYYPDPSTALPTYTPAQQPAAQAYVPHNQPRPGEYGQSVITDIRQMNF